MMMVVCLMLLHMLGWNLHCFVLSKSCVYMEKRAIIITIEIIFYLEASLSSASVMSIY